MSRYLLASSPADSDLAPLVATAAALGAAGHEVFWLAPRDRRDDVRAAGAVHCPPLASGPGLSAEADDEARLMRDLQCHGAQVQPQELVVAPGCAAAAATIAAQVGLPWRAATGRR